MQGCEMCRAGLNAGLGAEAPSRKKRIVTYMHNIYLSVYLTLFA